MMQMDRSKLEEAKRAKGIALEKYKAGDLAGAKEFALKAKNLYPTFCGLLRLIAVIDVLIGFGKKLNGEVDWYAVLGVDPTTDLSTVQRRYNELYLDIIIDRDNFGVSTDEAYKILANAWKHFRNENKKQLYDNKRQAHLRLQNLTSIPNVPHDNKSSSSSDSKPLEAIEYPAPSMTRDNPSNSDMQLRSASQFPSLSINPVDISKMSSEESEQKAEDKGSDLVQPPLRIFGHVIQPMRISGGESKRKEYPSTNLLHLNQFRRIGKNITNDMVKEEPELEVMSVPDPDFYNFDKDRTGASFGENQVWAAYDDTDGMPRFYALVHSVVSQEPFKLRISWLHSQNNEELGPVNWIDSGFYKTSGCFSIGERSNIVSVNSFSHRVQWKEETKGFVHIYPKKGDVWALYTNWSPSWDLNTPKEDLNKCGEMVEVLKDFDEEGGVEVVPLVKVPGFKTVFRRHPNQWTISKKELLRFSHQVTSHVLTGEDGENAPEGCLELDPAAMSPELLKVFNEDDMKRLDVMVKNPNEKVDDIVVQNPKEEVDVVVVKRPKENAAIDNNETKKESGSGK